MPMIVLVPASVHSAPNHVARGGTGLRAGPGGRFVTVQTVPSGFMKSLRISCRLNGRAPRRPKTES